MKKTIIEVNWEQIIRGKDFVEKIKKVITDDSRVLNVQRGKKIPASYAISENSPEALALILPGTKIEVIKKLRTTLLETAIKKDNPKLVETLLQNLAFLDLSAIKETGKLLHQAVSNGNLEIVKLLLSKGFSCHGKKQTDGTTALHVAARAGDIEMMTLLAKKGASYFDTTADGSTTMHFAAGQDDVEVIEHLAQQGLKYDVVKPNGSTLMHVAAFYGCINMMQHLSKNGVRYTESYSIDFNGEKKSVTPMHAAAAGGQEAAMHHLHEKGGLSYLEGERDGYSPYDYARCFNGISPEVLQMINRVMYSERGRNIDAVNTTTNNPVAVPNQLQPEEILRFQIARELLNLKTRVENLTKENEKLNKEKKEWEKDKEEMLRAFEKLRKENDDLKSKMENLQNEPKTYNQSSRPFTQLPMPTPFNLIPASPTSTYQFHPYPRTWSPAFVNNLSQTRIFERNEEGESISKQLRPNEISNPENTF